MFQMAALLKWTSDNNIPFYVQGEKYFEGYEDAVRKLYGTGISYVDRVSIHVRRAANPVDATEPAYSENAFYAKLDDDYYVRAMALFPGENFLVFSDDIEWCKQNPIFFGCEFSEGKTELEDMNLMAGCKHNIIANSSFSWWAAWLNTNLEKKVIAPARWFADPSNEHLIEIPSSWKRI